MPSGAASGDGSKNGEASKANSPSKGDGGRKASDAGMSIRLRSPSPDSPGMRSNKASPGPGTRAERMPTIPPRSGSVAGAGGANRLRKKSLQQHTPQARRQAHSNNVSYPPITLDKYRGLPMPLPPSSRAPAGPSPNWSMELDVDAAPNSESSSGRHSLDGSKGRGIALGDGVSAAEPLSVVPDANRGIPMVPQIPDTFRTKYGGYYGPKETQVEVTVRSENNRMEVDWPLGQAL